MASAGVLEKAASGVEAAVEDGNEGCGVGDLLEDDVQVFDNGGWAIEFAGAEAQGYSERWHEE